MKDCFLYKLMLLFAVVLLPACSVGELNDDIQDGGNLTLTFFSSSRPQGRTLLYQEEGMTELNENKLENLVCFFYPSTATDDTEALHRLYFSSLNGEKEVTVQSNLNDKILEELFPQKAEQCKIYVIANYLGQKIANTSVNALKQLEISSFFKSNSNPQPWFVMDGLGTVSYDRSARKLSGKVGLTRSAAKIMLNVTSVKEVTDENKTKWIPNIDGMRVMLRNGVKKSHIDSDKFPYEVKDEDRFDFLSGDEIQYEKKSYKIDGSEGYLYAQKLPFYSYPSDWSEGGRESYLLLVVPWHKEGESDKYQSCFYQIPINSELKNIKRNQYYKINLSVSTLGAFEEVKPTPIKPSYVILDWGTHEIKIDADLQNYRYLIVTPTKYVMHNRNHLIIPYASSHPVEISELSISYKDLSKEIPTINKKHFLYEQIPTNKYLKLSANHTLTYENILQNDFNKENFDFTPYTIEFTIRHKDKHEFFEKVEIIQYPAIYAENEINSDYNDDREHNNNKGYVFVNGYNGEPNKFYWNYDVFGTANGFTNSDASPNMYVFTVTSVKGTDYIIGDPRQKEESWLSNAKVMYNKWEMNKPAWSPDNNKNGRVLQHYYATDSTEASRKVIAPKFRIASGYAVLAVNSSEVKYLDALKKRCASYQEDGYPAGRWRLPTQAEFQFILTLVNKGKIPPLYLVDTPYWCAHGLGTPQKNGSVKMNYITEDKNGHSVRCVYDEWYWGSERLQDKTKFTWGDKPR